ncbi:MAG: flagellar assembly protein T N-terminal domain-containing protein [Gemmatimonadota bacterium]
MLLAALHPVAAAVTTHVRATGQAAVVGGNADGAFQEARRAALREAVEEGVGVLVSSATRVANFAVLDDRVLTRTSGYVRSYEVVERGVEGGVCRVVVEAVVDLDGLQRDLAGLELALAEAGNPRVVCLGAEVLSSADGDRTLEWGAVQADLGRAIAAAAPGAFLIELPSAGVDPLDRAATSDLLVRGEARLQSSSIPVPFSGARLEDTGLQSVAATVVVRVEWSDTGQAVSTYSGVGRAAATSFRAAAEGAIARAVGQIGGALARDLTEEIRAKAYSPRLVHLTLRAPAELRSRIEAELVRRIPSLEDLSPRSRGAGQSTYDIRVPASGFEIARRLSDGGLGELEVEVIQASANALSLSVADRGGRSAGASGESP